MTDYPDKTKMHLDSTNLGSSLTTVWSLDLEDQAIICQREAAAKYREAVGELQETVLAWLTCLYCWARNIFDPMSKNRLDSLTKKVGTQLSGTIACLEELEEADRELNRVYAAAEALADQAEPSSLDHLRHYWVDDSHEESKLSAEPPKKISLETNPLLVPPELSNAIGLHEAIVLQQMHYWLNKGAGKVIDGIRWIWNTLDDWLDQFKFLSKWQLRQALRRLRDELGLVKFSQQQKHWWDRTGWYTINYQRLKALQLSMCGPPHVEVWETTHQRVTVHTSYSTETTPEISSETTAPTAVILNFEEEEDLWSVVSTPELQPVALDFGEKALEVAQIISLVNQEEREPTESPKNLSEDKLSGAASAPVEKIDLVMDLVDDAGIPLNPQLKGTLVNYTLEQVKSAVGHYRSVSRVHRLNNPAGWLTECLKGQWWVVGTVTATQEVPHPASRVYTAADFEVEKSPTVPQSFKDMMAGLAKRHKLAT